MAYYLILEFDSADVAQRMKQALIGKVVFEGAHATRTAVYTVPEGEASSFTVGQVTKPLILNDAC